MGFNLGSIINPVASLNPLNPQGGLMRALGGGGGGGRPSANISPQQISQYAEEFRKQREIDKERGRKRGQELFGQESDIQSQRQEREKDIAGILARRKEIAEQGFGSKVFQAARESYQRGIKREEDLAMRQLRGSQGASGVGGPLASAQTAEFLRTRDANQRAAEQDLLLQETGLRQKALGDYSGAVQAEQQRLAQLLTGIAGLEYGEAGMGAGDRATAAQLIAAQNIPGLVRDSRSGGLLSSIFGGLFG